MSLAGILSGTLTITHAAAALDTAPAVPCPGPQRTPDSESSDDSKKGMNSGSGSTEAVHAQTKDTVAYPTASKEKERDRRNQLKAAGVEIKVKKKKFEIEDHHDDCGEDLSSLGPLHHDGRSVRTLRARLGRGAY